MFTSIVVGTDGSDTAMAAVRRAADLAQLCGAELHVVTAYRPITELVLNPEALPIDLGSLVNPERDAIDMSQKAAKQVAVSGMKVTAHTCAGDAADTLIDVAAEVNGDLIVVGNRGMRGTRRVLGSVPNSVSHHAACTVMIVQTS